MVVAKTIDFCTIFAILLFLTKQQVGVASVVLSIGMVVEAFNGLGASEALLQARSVTSVQLYSLFWYIMLAAILVGAVTLCLAPVVKATYGPNQLSSYFVAVAAKQIFVGAAVIPLALLNRDLKYERIAVVNVCATIAAAATRLCLAALGAGAWALVVGSTASGLTIFLGAMLARPFRPRLQFQASAIRPLVRFGTRAASANIVEQMFKNIDFLLVGWFYGAAILAVYRIAFDVAMEPAMAVATLVNRTALPVFARVAAVAGQLQPILVWALRRSVMLVAPLTAGLLLIADQLTGLLHDEKGNTYAAAAVPLKLLAGTAILRVMAQLLPTVMLVSGRPGSAARLSATVFLLLTAGILSVGFILPARIGTVAVSAVWLGVYAPLVFWGAGYLKRHWAIRAWDLGRAVTPPLLGIAAMGVAVRAAWSLTGISDPKAQIGVVCVAVAITYVATFRTSRSHPN